jgi:8-amino-7-oxononanoate synthase/acyl carrier protein
MTRPESAPSTDLVSTLRYWAQTTPGAKALHFTDGEDGPDESLTFAELDQAARAIAVDIAENARPGARGLLMFPPSLEFVCAFFGCLYAGCVAVPAFPPRRNRKGARLSGIAEDCAATFALTVSSVLRQIQGDEDARRELSSLNLIATNVIDRSLAMQYKSPMIDPQSPGMLQYTSGSTGEPKGVVLSHNNLIRNTQMITELFGLTDQAVGVSWLPAYHDMGLIGGILTPIYLGRPTILMSPMSFLQRPVRWLKTITRYGGTTSGGPNFAYQLCVDKISDEEMEGLDLSKWRVAFNGAEPVRSNTIAQFSERFASVGFQSTSHLPCYGMAETTLIVSGGPAKSEPVEMTVDGRQLDARNVVEVEATSDKARRLVGCGQILDYETVLIVDPTSHEILSTVDDDISTEVGEIWTQGPSVGKGYWENAKETERIFGAKTSDGQGPFLRTGDLGFFARGQLYIVGRVKDVIIVRGVNRYPQDIEQTVEECHESIASMAAAAFSVSQDNREQLIVAVEVQRSAEDDWAPVITQIRRSVTQQYELPPDAVYLVRFGSLPKTSSGKVQRHACRNDFESNSFRVIDKWESWNTGMNDQAPMIAASTFVGNNTNLHTNTSSNGKPAPRGKKVHAPDRDIVEFVKRTVRTVAQDRAKQLDLDTNIILDLGLDSLERLEIAHKLENAFGGRFPEEVLQDIETIREISEALESNFGKSRLRVSDMEDSDSDSENLIAHNVTEEDYCFNKMPEYQRLKQTMAQFEMTGMPNPYFSVHKGLTRDTTNIDGRELISFASYNYLGMSGDPEVSSAVVDAVHKYGTSVSASRLVSGEKDIHRQLEMRLANWIGAEDAVVLIGGHSTNETVIGHIVGPGDLILHDALSHNSIVQGAMLSGARRRAFPHNDYEALDRALTELRGSHRRVLVIVEGVYSMDGDYPDLPKFVEVKAKHKCWLMVDEAHSIGTMGKTGRGIGEHFGVDPKTVDIWMGTLSKSFGSCGGYIAGPNALIEYLKYTAPGFVFSVGLSPPNVAAALQSIEVLEREPHRIDNLRDMSTLFLTEARNRGLNTGQSNHTPVVPVITGNSLHALQLSQRLLASGINVQPILYPAVEESAARLRFFINSTHSRQQILYTVEQTELALREIAPELFRPAVRSAS